MMNRKISTILLTITFNILFINNIYAEEFSAAACSKAVERGDIAGALNLVKVALAKNRQDKDALICQGRALGAKNDVPGAIAAFDQAQQNAATNFDKALIAIMAGNVYARVKDHAQAISRYQQAVQSAQTDRNVQFERIAHNLIGDAYAQAQQYKEALASYTIAEKLSQNDNDRGESYENLALTHHRMQAHDLALEYQIKAFFMHERAGTLDQYAHSGIELGRYYLVVKNYVSAENTLNKILKLAQEQGGAYYEAQASYLLAKLKAATGDQPAAKQLVEQARQIAKTTQDQALEQEISLETQGL